VVFGLLLAAIAPFFPLLYNTSSEVRSLATNLILILAVMKPMMAYLLSIYYSMRSGGKTIMTFLYDAGIMWTVCIPLAYCLSRFAKLPIIPLYVICQSAELLKCTLGFIMIRQGKWIQNLTK
jgi:Na+-driven multidrug efflux pump